MTWRSHVSRPLNYWRFSNSFGNGHRGIRFALTVADMSMFSMDNRLRRASSQWVDNGFGQASEFLRVIYTKLWCRQNMTRIQGMRTVSERPCSAYVCNCKTSPYYERARPPTVLTQSLKTTTKNGHVRHSWPDCADYCENFNWITITITCRVS